MKYINDLTQEFGSSQHVLWATKDGLSVGFDVDFGLDDDLKLTVEHLELKSCEVIESNVSVTPNEDWLSTLAEELKAELPTNETFLSIEEKRIEEYYSEESDRDFSRRMRMD